MLFRNMQQNNPPANGTRALPKGATNAITGKLIDAGEPMVNFNGLSSKHKFFTYKTFRRLHGRNPFTRKAIRQSTVRKFRARGGTRQRA